MGWCQSCRDGWVEGKRCPVCKGAGFVDAPAYTDHELLELFQMLLRSQIREERINSIEELHGLLRHVERNLDAAKVRRFAPLSAPSPSIE